MTGTAPQSEDSARNPAFACAAALVAIVAVAAAVRLWGLTRRELWLDESCTFFAIDNLFDWPAAGPPRFRELAHWPYFLLLRAWTAVTGDGELGLRSFYTVTGCLSVLALGLAGRRIGGRSVGLIAAALAALHPLHIYYSQEARVYATWSLCVTIMVYCLFQAGRSAQAKWWIAYGTALLLTILTHYYALLLIPGTVTTVFVAHHRRRFFRQWLVVHAAIGVLLVPIVCWMVVPLAAGGPRPWLQETWLSYPPALAIPKSLWAMLPSGGYPSYLGALSLAGDAVTARLGLVLAMAAMWGPAVIVAILLVAQLTRTGPTLPPIDDPEETGTPSVNIRDAGRVRAILFLFALSLAFLLTAWCFSWLVSPTYIVGRYDLAVWPSLTLGLSLLIVMVTDQCSLRGTAASVEPPTDGSGRPIKTKTILVTAVLLGCSFITIICWRAVPVSNDLTRRARRVATLVGPADLVISIDMYKWFMAYEWKQIGFDAEVISFPPKHDQQLCWNDAEAELAEPGQIVADAAATATRINRGLASGRRVWLLAHGEPVGARWEVDRHLFGELRQMNIEIRLVDEWVGLAELVPSGPGSNKAGEARN